MFNAVLISMASGILFLSLHFLLWQWLTPERKGVYLIVAVALTSYGFVMLGSFIFLNLSPHMHLWVSLPFYMLLLMGYLHLYVGIERSISVRILGELVQANDNRIEMASLNKIYSYDYMIRHRIELMRRANWLIENNGNYTCAPKGRRLSRIAILLKKFYGIELTG